MRLDMSAAPQLATESNMQRIFKYGVLLFLLAAFVGCDQITKDMAKRELADAFPHVLLGGLMRLTYAENPGTFMGLGAQLDEVLRIAIYCISGIVILAGFVVLFAFTERLRRVTSCGLLVVLAGASGNLIDRFANGGRVIDFMVVGVGQVHTGVFNLADVFIAAGLVVLVFGFRKHHGSGHVTNGFI
jgi:signal peptidase II